ncbi:MAG: hypothetical protein V1738_06025 [Patescibacteria group bacterium]
MDSCQRCNGKGTIPDFLGGRLGGEACADCGGTGRAPGSAISALATGGTYRITVDRGRTLGEAIAAGRYDSVDSDINSRNYSEPSPVPGEAEAVLVHLDRVATTAEAEAGIAHPGLRPVTLWELLAFGERYPDVQRQFPVIALGSSWIDSYGGRVVPLLFGCSGGRGLGLSWDDPGDIWLDDCRFLAVRM